MNWPYLPRVRRRIFANIPGLDFGSQWEISMWCLLWLAGNCDTNLTPASQYWASTGVKLSARRRDTEREQAREKLSERVDRNWMTNINLSKHVNALWSTEYISARSRASFFVLRFIFCSKYTLCARSKHFSALKLLFCSLRIETQI